MPAWRSSRWPSCEIRSSSVPDPMAYFLSSYSRAALSAEMMKPAVPSALWMPQGWALTERSAKSRIRDEKVSEGSAFRFDPSWQGAKRRATHVTAKALRGRVNRVKA